MPSRPGRQAFLRFLTDHLVMVRMVGGIRTIQRARRRLGPDFVQALDGTWVPRWRLSDYEAGNVKALSEFDWNANEHGRCLAETRAKQNPNGRRRAER